MCKLSVPLTKCQNHGSSHDDTQSFDDACDPRIMHDAAQIREIKVWSAQFVHGKKNNKTGEHFFSLLSLVFQRSKNIK